MKSLSQDLAVTVITIGDPVGGIGTPTTNDDPPEICLPPVLQDRKRVPSATFGGNRITLSSDPALNLRKAVVGASNRPDVIATCAAVASKLASNVNGNLTSYCSAVERHFRVVLKGSIWSLWFVKRLLVFFHVYWIHMYLYWLECCLNLERLCFTHFSKNYLN